MTSDDISSSFLALTGACDDHRCVEEKPETWKARVSSVEAHNFRFCRSVDEEAIMAARVPKRQSKSDESRRRMGIFRSSFWRVGARENSGGDQLLGFRSREAVDHVSVVGFIS